MALPKDELRQFYIPGRKTPLHKGKGAKKGMENREEFLYRAAKEMPLIFRAVNGNEQLVADYFDKDVRFVKDMCRLFPDVESARREVQATELARIKEGDNAAIELGVLQAKRLERRENLPTRANWPRKNRRAEQRKWLRESEALIHYEGILPDVADASNIPLHELICLVDGDQNLQKQRDLGLRVAGEYAVQRMCALTRETNTIAAIKYFLGNVGDKWRDKQEVTVSDNTFEPPPSQQMGSVIQIVKDDKDGDATGDRQAN